MTYPIYNNKNITITLILCSFLFIVSCAPQLINLTSSNVSVVNREIAAVDKSTNAITLNNQVGDGLAVLDNVDFEVGTIEIELKGENTPGRSFVGVAFNIQNDSTYEAVYFRPFNFQAKEKMRREHSVQYISHPKHTWRFLRTNYEGQYEAAYDRQPSPEEWFEVKIVVDKESVTVTDKNSDEELLSIQRIGNTVSNKIGLWTGNNSKGAFRNLRVKN